MSHYDKWRKCSWSYVPLALAMTVFICGGLPGCAPGPTADFVIAPHGNDANPGTVHRPFATLERARRAVNILHQREPQRDVRVLLRGGTYRIQHPVMFLLEDSVAPGYTTTYEAWPGELPVLSAGVPIRGWQRGYNPRGLSEAARGKVWSAPVPSTIQDVLVLYDGDRRLPRARGAGFVPISVPTETSARDQSTKSVASRHEILFPEGTVRGEPKGCRWELIVVPRWPWTMNILPITDFDTFARLIRTNVPATYPLEKVTFGHFPGGTAWIENAPEVLDEPGEWVFDAQARRIYLWPEGDRPSAEIVAPALTEMIRIEGAIDDEGPRDRPVRGLVFRGLQFTHGNRYAWSPNKTGLGLQHDWEMFDRPTALVRLRGAEECVFEACRFVNTGGTAIRLDLHAQRNTVRGNLIAHTGGVGVLLAGYGPGTKDVNRENRIEGNHIHHVGELLWHSPAVFVWQSGSNRIAGNLIHDCPYTAVVVSGRILWERTGTKECARTIRWWEVDAVLPPEIKASSWAQREPFLHGRHNVVEANEIFEVMKTLGDGNAIYISGTGRGNVIRGNYIHDSTGPHMNAAIRCDDDQHGTMITHNIVWRTCGEGFINKGNNTFTNNIFADIRSCHREGVRKSRGFIVLPYGDLSGTVIERNIFYSTNQELPALTEGSIRNYPPALLRECQSDRNLYFCTQNSAWAEAMLREQCAYGVEGHSLEADPRFVAIEQGDFRLLPDSPALKLGIEQLTPAVVDRSVFPFNTD